MAGYPKIWTTIRHEPWYKRLPAIQRAIWLESILIAKEQTDNGWVCFRNVSHFAQETGCDRGSIDRWIAESTQNGRIIVSEKTKQILRFQIVHYNNSQQVKCYEPSRISFPKAEQSRAEHKAEQNKDITAPPYSGKPTDESGKNRDPIRDYLLDSVIAEIKSRLNVDLKCQSGYAMVGRIIKLAGWKRGEPYPWGTYGRIMVAIGRIAGWVTGSAFIGAITLDLKRTHTEWPDADRERIKAYENKFEQWMNAEIPQRIQL